MTIPPRAAALVHLFLALMCTLVGGIVLAQPAESRDERAIKDVLARFYEGWNTHDIEKMVSVYAEDIDHINVFAEWHRGKPAIREALTQFHAGPAKNNRKTYTVEKIRFLKPDVAIAHVRSLSTVGNLGTYVMSKESGTWLVVSFTNVRYELTTDKQTRGKDAA